MRALLLGFYHALYPPSTLSTAPVMHNAPDLARNAIAAATSSGPEAGGSAAQRAVTLASGITQRYTLWSPIWVCLTGSQSPMS
jgi:hypothetical protein